MKHLVLPFAVAALLSGCASVPATAGALADVTVVDRTTGERLPVYSHAGKLYVAGTPGNRYAVEVANRSGGRILTVISVDGVNVITGDTAAPDQSGYVFSPWQRYEIAGWRKSMGEIAQFYFTRLPDSYAARTDRPDNVGVIGVAVFREWTPPRPPASVAPTQPRAKADGRANESASAADAASAPAAPQAGATAKEAARAYEREEKLGTGHGERERSEVLYTNFRRAAPYPNETITIYYDSRANLVARGVIPGAPAVGTPNPFPGGRFVPDPRG
ncbi:MAG: hypothetical protein MUF79_04345 [Burkholderiales bacterium]|jgi:hypothetical protein|nr:hypothetical protein [Burkholderiales bacterium]